MTVIGVAVVFDAIHLAIFARWVVHHKHCLLIEVIVAPKFFVERLWSIGLVAHKIARCRTKFPAEFGRRHTIGKRENVVDIAEHLHFFGFELLLLRACGSKFAQLHSIVAKLPLHLRSYLRGIVARISFGHSLLRHYTIFFHQVGNAGKCAAIA